MSRPAFCASVMAAMPNWIAALVTIIFGRWPDRSLYFFLSSAACAKVVSPRRTSRSIMANWTFSILPSTPSQMARLVLSSTVFANAFSQLSSKIFDASSCDAYAVRLACPTVLRVASRAPDGTRLLT
jgi:hypothetical protein